MKRLSRLFFAGVMLVSFASCNGGYKYESVPDDPTGMRIYTLDNGLKVYMSVNKDKPRIDAQVAVKVGSKNDPRETTGLAHYFEHLMFKGTEQFGTQNYEMEKPLLDQIEQLFEVYRKTEDEAERKAIYHQIDSISYEASKIAIPNEYDKLMASIGATGTNAYTSYDVTCYVENIPSNQIEAWAKVQADRFQNCVLRGFHTELETIYEEFNMYNAMDSEKETGAFMAALFPNHPYNTDVIGIPSHLKNPSITNVKKYHDEWYVPNNMAIVMSGDFDPDETIKVIDRYFSALKPNDNLPVLEFEPEEPITEPIVKTVLGNESPNVILGWRFPGANQPEALMLDLLGEVLNNGKAGLIDVDVNQKQKVLYMGAGAEELADYSVFLVQAEPLPGQSLDEVRDIALAELEKVKNGEFDESLLKAIVNNIKYNKIRSFENTSSVASAAVDCFIDDIPWRDVVNYADNISKITKDQLVEFVKANFKDNYVQVNKLEQPDPTDTRIAKPEITPIFTNRDTASLFLRDIQKAASEVDPIEPVFVDYQKDMSIVKAKSGIDVLYKKNETNGTFSINYTFETGSYADKVLPYACDYFDYLGTSDMTLEEINNAFYALACNYSISCTGERTVVALNGLAENMDEAMRLLEHVIVDVQPDPEALALYKMSSLQSRRNAKLDQSYNFSALQSYGLYGASNPFKFDLTNAEINALTDEELIEKIHTLFNNQHEILYYGPLSSAEFVSKVNEIHRCPETLAPVVSGDPFKYLTVDRSEVYLAPYDANQLQLYSISNTGEMYDPEMVPMVRLYNSYFGSGMNSIVFQEMREARGLAYSAAAAYSLPSDRIHNCLFLDMIYTQNDKLMDALDAFDEIINNMPVSQAAFDIAKESLISTIRTQRTTKSSVLNSYLNARKLGIDYDINKLVYEKAQNYTLDDVVKFQQENIRGRKLKVMILGRIEDLDLKSLEKYGEITKLSTEEIFGY